MNESKGKSHAHNSAWITFSIVAFIALTWTAFYFSNLLTCPTTGWFDEPSTCVKSTDWTGAPIWITYFTLLITIAAIGLRNLNEIFEDEK